MFAHINKMKKLYIVGGNGFAKECYEHIQSNIEKGDDICFGGFVGHNGYHVDFAKLSHYFIGDLSEIQFKEDDFCIIGAGYPELRRIIYNDLKHKGAQLYNLIIGNGRLSDLVELGEGNILNASFPSPFVQIGHGNVFNFEVVIAHDTLIGDFNFIGPRSQILGNARIGNDNTIGSNTVILPNSKIGNHNKIAPLSAIYKGCRNYCYMQGNPALKVGEVSQ
jgi:acetyltransferase EpsM